MLKEEFILKHVIHAKQSGNAITVWIEQFKIVICVIKSFIWLCDLKTIKTYNALIQMGGDVMQSAIDAFNKANSVPQICFPGNGELT